MLCRLVQLVIGKMKRSKFKNLRWGHVKKKKEKSETEKEIKKFFNFQYQIIFDIYFFIKLLQKSSLIKNPSTTPFSASHVDIFGIATRSFPTNVPLGRMSWRAKRTSAWEANGFPALYQKNKEDACKYAKAINQSITWYTETIESNYQSEVTDLPSSSVLTLIGKPAKPRPLLEKLFIQTV